jgi:ATP-dependent DNA helicase PIF1
VSPRRPLLDVLRDSLQSGAIPSRDELQQDVPAPTLHDQLEASLEEQQAKRREAFLEKARAFAKTERGVQGLAGRTARAQRRLGRSLGEVLGEGGGDDAATVAAASGNGAGGVQVLEPPAPVPPVAPEPPPAEPTRLDPSIPFQFVSGPAGCGKTWLLKDLAATDPSCVLAATTGIAAVNLGEGTTINSLLRYFQLTDLRDSYTGGYLESHIKKLRKAGLTRILLDEVSMMHADHLTIITRALDNVNADRGDDPELGLIVCGDFLQLPPVPDVDQATGKKMPVQLAFESPEWDRYAAHTVRLARSWRQTDPAFLAALAAVRRSDADAALTYFGPRLQAATDLAFDGPLIVGRNDEVDRFNQLRLDKVSGREHTFPSTRWGKVRPDWGGPPKPPAQWGIPEALTLKEGCRVMVLANKNDALPGDGPRYRYTNGDLGTFLGPHQGGAVVRLDRTGMEAIAEYVQRENQIPLEPGRKKALAAEGHAERAKDRWEIIGGVEYLPLRLCYSSTVHKSQSLTLDKVQVSIRSSFFRQAGLLYVALSRARTPDGLRIVGTTEGFRARCTVSPRVRAWI